MNLEPSVVALWKSNRMLVGIAMFIDLDILSFENENIPTVRIKKANKNI